MPTTLTGSTATDPTTAPTLSAPAAGDAVASGPMDTALQNLLNAVAWIRANMGPLGAANSWIGTQLFQAAVTLSELLTANANVALSKAGDQTILKGGSGKLQLGTSIDSNLELLVGGAAKAILRASDGCLGGLTDPALAQDAATKAFVDRRALTGGVNANGTARSYQLDFAYTRESAGTYRVDTSYFAPSSFAFVVGAGSTDVRATVAHLLGGFRVYTRNGAGTLTDADFDFVIVT